TTLVGPNGAGKTTLFNQITGHIMPDGGDILWQDESILGLAPWKIARKGVARTFQDLRLFDEMTVEENILTVMEPRAWFWQPNLKESKSEKLNKLENILERTQLSTRRKTRAVDLSYAE